MHSRMSNPWHSLERKLPLLIGGVVALLLLAALGISHYEVRQSAVQAADERLQRVAGQLGEWVDGSLRTRERLVAGVAADPAVVALFDEAARDDAAATAVLERLRTRSDSALPLQVRDTRGRLVFGSGEDALVSGGEPLPAQLARVSDEITYGPFSQSPEGGQYWVTAPIRSGEHTLGHIHQLRRVGSRALAEQLEPLIGTGFGVYFANAEGGPWVALDGSWLSGTPQITPGTTFQHDRRDGWHYAFGRSVGGGQWLLIVDTSLDHVLSSTRAVARRVLALGTLLLLLGGLSAWLVSRSVTSPLRRLALAADAVAAGDYARRTGVERTDEIGQLARSFDAMTAHVEATHVELEHQFHEARQLAAELKDANARLHRAVQEIDHARSQAQEASQAKSEFLATISHEIRTPINAVIGYTDLLELGLGGTLSEQQRDYVDRIRRSGEHLTALVNDVLDFAKIESGQMRVLSEVRSAPASIHAAVSMLQGQVQEAGLQLSVDCPVEAVYLGDPYRVQQILINLIGNSIKFTPRGGAIRIACERRSSRAVLPFEQDGEKDAAHCDWLCFTVSDTGIGIAPDQLERIFDPFVQGQPGYTRPHGGAGLGLAISRSLARIMSGDITVDRTPGCGASFTLWMPHPAALAPAAAAADPAERNTRSR